MSEAHRFSADELKVISRMLQHSELSMLDIAKRLNIPRRAIQQLNQRLGIRQYHSNGRRRSFRTAHTSTIAVRSTSSAERVMLCSASDPDLMGATLIMDRTIADHLFGFTPEHGTAIELEVRLREEAAGPDSSRG